MIFFLLLKRSTFNITGHTVGRCCKVADEKSCFCPKIIHVKTVKPFIYISLVIAGVGMGVGRDRKILQAKE